MKCPDCGSTDYDESFLFPRENFDDKTYECLECGHKWDFIKKDEKPSIKLSGVDGNAFSILAVCRQAMKKADWSEKKQTEFLDEAQSKDYDHLMMTVMKRFDVR